MNYPINIFDGRKIADKFRKTDIKFGPKTHTITNVLLHPDKPPIYILDNDNNTGYTKNQLQIVEPEELKLIKRYKL